jgi:glycosyltransferase involved in cell wall biosynthesis
MEVLVANPRIRCICVVKNEADIIGHTLSCAKEWAHRIYVLDNGSTDGTWEIVQGMRGDDVIVPFKRDEAQFRDSIRSEVFNAFVHEADRGDWWCRLDADEMFCECPGAVIQSLEPHESVLWGIALEYYLTQEDINAVEHATSIERILSAIRYYKIEHTELRFFRHHPRLRWDSRQNWPRMIGPVASRRILYRHYKYRTPEQIQARIHARLTASPDHWWAAAYSGKEWRDLLGSRDALHFDDGQGQYDVSRVPDHRGPLGRRVIKRVLWALSK